MKKYLILCLIAVAGIYACGQKPSIDVQAHRGGAGLMPENTRSAMQNVLDLGVNSTYSFPLTARSSCHTTTISIHATPHAPTAH